MSQFYVPPDLNEILKDIKTRLQSLSAAVNRLSVPSATGPVAIDYGTAVLNFSASPDSSATTVSHALGRAPTSVLLTGYVAPAFGEIPILQWALPTSTQFQVSGQTTASWTGSVNFSWLAIG